MVLIIQILLTGSRTDKPLTQQVIQIIATIRVITLSGLPVCYLRFLLFVIFLYSPDSHPSKPLRMAYIEFPPFNFTDEDGVARGNMTELARDLAERAGYTITFRSFPAKRLAKTIVEGGADFWIGLPTLENFSEGTIISSIPVGSIHLRAYSKKPMPPIRSKADLDGKHIIILHGYSYGDWFEYIQDPKNNITYESTFSHAEALRMLLTRPVDYLLDYNFPISLAKKSMKVPELFSNEVYAFERRIVVSKKTPGAKEVLRRLEEAYTRLMSEDEVE